MLVFLALLGIPLWFPLGAVAMMLMRRRAIAAIPGTFPCQIRIGTDSADLASQTWTRGHGRWEHDVFVMAQPRSITGFTAQAANDLRANDTWFPAPGGIKHVGEHPVVLVVWLASSRVLEIAVALEHVATAAGPFPVPAIIPPKRDRTHRVTADV